MRKKSSSWKWFRAGYEIRSSHRGSILDELFREPRAPLFLISEQTLPCSPGSRVPLMIVGHQGTAPVPCAPSHPRPGSPGTPTALKRKRRQLHTCHAQTPHLFLKKQIIFNNLKLTQKRAIIKKNFSYWTLTLNLCFRIRKNPVPQSLEFPKITRRDTTRL